MTHRRPHGTAACAAAIVLLSAAATAGPLETRRLPADTAWLMHVDFEQVRSSTAGRFLMHDECGLEIDDMREDLAQQLGFDLFTEAMDLTIQGPRDDEHGGVIVLTATPKVDQTVQYIQQEESSHDMMLVDDYELHTWHDRNSDEQLYLHMQSIERGTRRQAVLSPSLSRLLLTLKTMQGDAPSVTDVRSAPLAINPRPGTLLYAQAASLEFMPDIDLDEHITAAVGRVTFELSEHEDMSRMDLSCTADSEQRAKTVSEILQGLIAVGKLISSEDDDLAMLHHVLLATKSSARGNEVGLSFAIPSDELEKMMHDEPDHERRHGRHHD